MASASVERRYDVQNGYWYGPFTFGEYLEYHRHDREEATKAWAAASINMPLHARRGSQSDKELQQATAAALISAEGAAGAAAGAATGDTANVTANATADAAAQAITWTPLAPAPADVMPESQRPKVARRTSGVVIKSEYLLKDPRRKKGFLRLFARPERRLFYLHEEKLEWYRVRKINASEQGFEFRGSMALIGAHIKRKNNSLTVVSKGERLVLRDIGYLDHLGEWRAAIQEQLNQQPMAEKVYWTLTAFDDGLAHALGASTIRLVSSAWFLDQKAGFRLPYRQELEKEERSGVIPSPLLSPRDAVALLRQGRRCVGAVTHGWLSPGDPDPEGRRVQVLQKALRARPHIVSFFFECVS